MTLYISEHIEVQVSKYAVECRVDALQYTGIIYVVLHITSDLIPMALKFWMCNFETHFSYLYLLPLGYHGLPEPKQTHFYAAI